MDRARSRTWVCSNRYLLHLPRRLQLSRGRVPSLRFIRAGSAVVLPQYACGHLSTFYGSDVPTARHAGRLKSSRRLECDADGRAVGVGILWAENQDEESVCE